MTGWSLDFMLFPFLSKDTGGRLSHASSAAGCLALVPELGLPSRRPAVNLIIVAASLVSLSPRNDIASLGPDVPSLKKMGLVEIWGPKGVSDQTRRVSKDTLHRGDAENVETSDFRRDFKDVWPKALGV